MYWYLKVARGSSLDEVSDLFAQSSEFRTRYGNLDNADFVELIYQNVLGRGADSAGRDYWVGRLNGGLSRGRVMRYFSESGEYQRETATGVPSEWRAGRQREEAARRPPRGRGTSARRLRPRPLPALGRHRPRRVHHPVRGVGRRGAERRHVVLVVGRQARVRVGSPRHRPRRRARRGMGLGRVPVERVPAQRLRGLAGQPRGRQSERRGEQGWPGRRRLVSAACEVGLSLRRDHHHDQAPLGPVGGRRREGRARRAAQRLQSHDVQSAAGHRTAQAAAEGDPLRRFALHGVRQVLQLVRVAGRAPARRGRVGRDRTL